MTCLCQCLTSPGVRGALVGAGVFAFLYFLSFLILKPGNYRFHPPNRDSNGEQVEGYMSFEPIIARYHRLAEFVVGLATGSIVLLAGSSVIRSGGKVPWFYGSPLVLLAVSVVYAVLFMTLISYNYEEWLYFGIYSHHRYRFSSALGFSALLCFGVGYIWLAFQLVRA